MRCSPKGRQSGAATGFIAGFAGRLTARRPLVWVRQDFTEIESGALSMSGLAELGLDPRRLVSVRAADVDTALRTTADALACDAVGAVVLEVWGEARQLDLVASRKLTLAAQASGVTCLVLRVAAEPAPSTAESRWIVQAAHSPPASHIPRQPGLPGARLCSTRSSFVIVTARSGDGSWNGNVMSAFSANPRRILSLWLPRLPIDRIKRELGATAARRLKCQSVFRATRMIGITRPPTMTPASSSPSKTTRCRFTRWMMPPPVLVLRRPAAGQCAGNLPAFKSVRCR